MKIRCVQCQAELALGMTACPSCGRPVDADGNGLPDSLDQMVQSAAKKAVAEERAQERAREEQGARAKERRMLELQLQENALTPRTWVGLALYRARNTFLVMLFVMATMGIPIRMVLASGGIGLSGPLLCVVQCPECGPPGRAFAWNYRGSCQENQGRMGYAYVCSNPRVDVSTLQWIDVRTQPLNDVLQPYMVHGALTFVGDVLVGAALVSLLRALVGTGARLRKLDAERAELERKLANLPRG